MTVKIDSWDKATKYYEENQGKVDCKDLHEAYRSTTFKVCFVVALLLMTAAIAYGAARLGMSSRTPLLVRGIGAGLVGSASAGLLAFLMYKIVFWIQIENEKKNLAAINPPLLVSLLEE